MHQLSAKLLFIPFLTLIISSCSSVDPNAPLRERNEAVDEYFVTMEEVVDEYCDMVENMVMKAKELEEKEENGQKASLSDGLGFLKDMGTSVFSLARLAAKMEKLQAQHPEFQKELNEVDFKEFSEIYGHMIDRFMDMAKKLEALEKNEEADQAAA